MSEYSVKIHSCMAGAGRFRLTRNKYASGSSAGGIKRTRAYILTRQMSERGLIEIVGRGAGKRFRRILGQ